MAVQNSDKHTLKTMSLNRSHEIQSIELTSMNKIYLKESANIFNEYTNWQCHIS